MMICIDRSGLLCHTPDSATGEHLDEAIDRLVHFKYEMTTPVRQALTEDAFFPLAQALEAYLAGLSTDAKLASERRASFSKFMDKAAKTRLTDQEKAHLRAALLLLSGNMSAAAKVLTDISLAYPLDVLALAIGHQIDLLLGDTVALRDRIGATLPCWQRDHPYYAGVLAMFAFGLEENGHWAYAEQLGIQAAEMDPANVWAIHAVAHTFEMRARFDEGAAWLRSCRMSWEGENQMRSHIWWHYCLYLLEQGDLSAVFRIYDDWMAPARIDPALTKLVNGSSLLWRLRLQGVDTADRFTDMAAAWQPRVHAGWCAFNDIHAMMSYLGAGNDAAATALIADREDYLANGPPQTDNVSATAVIGLPVCKALLAFERCHFDEALDLIYPIRRVLYRCGGSHAQRDVIHQTLLEAAIRSGHKEEARCLVGERLAIRPDSPFNLHKLAEIAQMRPGTSCQSSMRFG